MTPEDLQCSIEGVMREIAQREGIIRQMRLWYKEPGHGTASYTIGYIMKEGPRILRELNKLKTIKAELIYLYELSKLQAA